MRKSVHCTMRADAEECTVYSEGLTRESVLGTIRAVSLGVVGVVLVVKKAFQSRFRTENAL